MNKKEGFYGIKLGETELGLKTGVFRKIGKKIEETDKKLKFNKKTKKNG